MNQFGMKLVIEVRASVSFLLQRIFLPNGVSEFMFRCIALMDGLYFYFLSCLYPYSVFAPDDDLMQSPLGCMYNMMAKNICVGDHKVRVLHAHTHTRRERERRHYLPCTSLFYLLIKNGFLTNYLRYVNKSLLLQLSDGYS